MPSSRGSGPWGRVSNSVPPGESGILTTSGRLYWIHGRNRHFVPTNPPGTASRASARSRTPSPSTRDGGTRGHRRGGGLYQTGTVCSVQGQGVAGRRTGGRGVG